MNYVDKAENYFCNNFNCSQAVFTTFATELGLDEENVSKKEDMVKIKELDLFKTTCPKMIRCATELVEQIITEIQ